MLRSNFNSFSNAIFCFEKIIPARSKTGSVSLQPLAAYAAVDLTALLEIGVGNGNRPGFYFYLCFACTREMNTLGRFSDKKKHNKFSSFDIKTVISVFNLGRT